jgi:hypothetical protein
MIPSIICSTAFFFFFDVDGFLVPAFFGDLAYFNALGDFGGVIFLFFIMFPIADESLLFILPTESSTVNNSLSL